MKIISIFTIPPANAGGGYALMDVRDVEEATTLTERFLDIIGTGTCHLHEVGPTPF